MSEYEFDRYVDGQLRAEGVGVNKAISLDNAFSIAARLVRAESGTVLVLRKYPGQDAELTRLTEKVAQLEAELQGYKEAHASKCQLTRELDVILNGDGAAKQASLCDIVGQAANGGLPMQKECERLRVDANQHKDIMQWQLFEKLQAQAGLLLLTSMREPVSESLAMSLGNLSLCLKALYDHKTDRLKAQLTKEQPT